MDIDDLKIDFKKLKKGDTVYSAAHGELIFLRMSTGMYRIVCRKGKQGREISFTRTGKESMTDKNPTLFTKNPFDYLEEKEITTVFIPKVMEVSMDQITWYEKYVIHVAKIGVISISASATNLMPCYWRHSREVQKKQVQFEEFTLEELAKLAGKNPELIRLKANEKTK